MCLVSDHFWTSQPRTLCQRYEDLVREPVTGVKAIAAHLGVALADDEAVAVAERYSLDANRRRTAELATDQAPDPQTLLHRNHIRAGRVGGWREEATPRELAVVASICGSWLIARGYEPDDSWAAPALEHLCRQLEAHRLAARAMSDELDETRTQLHELQQLGPLALGVARRLHGVSLRHPRLVASVKRLVNRASSLRAGSVSDGHG
jgi:hypothetical protein